MAFGSPPIETGSTPILLRIACPCGHAGVVSVDVLPGELTCSRCGSCRHIEDKDCAARIRSKEGFIERALGKHRPAA
jgi:hypothetical protein